MDSAPTSPTTSPPFTLGDVFGDAYVSFKERLGTHLRFNVLVAACMVVQLCCLGCVAFTFVFGATSAGAGEVLMLESFALIAGGIHLLVFVFATTMLHAFTLAVSLAHLRGAVLDLSSGLRAMGTRLLAQLGLSVAKLGIDGIVCGTVLGAFLFYLGSTLVGPPAGYIDELRERLGEMAALDVLVIVLIVGWMIFVRAFTGLAPVLVQVESLGPIEALRQSARRLSGRRLHFVGLHMVWLAIATLSVGLLAAPMIALYAMSKETEHAAKLFALLTMAYALFFSIAVLFVLTFDSVLEAAYFARLSKRSEPGGIAEVFS